MDGVRLIELGVRVNSEELCRLGTGLLAEELTEWEAVRELSRLAGRIPCLRREVIMWHMRGIQDEEMLTLREDDWKKLKRWLPVQARWGMSGFVLIPARVVRALERINEPWALKLRNKVMELAREAEAEALREAARLEWKEVCL